MAKDKKLLIVQVAGLGLDFLRYWKRNDIGGLSVKSADSIFPAVTCPVQASFRTATPPNKHGMVSNAIWSAQQFRPSFWEQSSQFVQGERIWDTFRKNGGKVGMMFWQQSLGEDLDLVLSPAPIHTHGGGMIQDCYSKPKGLYRQLQKKLGNFKLHRYWGPLASAKVGDWIADATATVLGETCAPDLLFVYLPSLDYDLQRYGPRHTNSGKALDRTCRQLEKMISAVTDHGYEILVFSDYAIGETKGQAIYPNRILYEAGFMRARKVRKMLYPDYYTTAAFAVVDHQVAHVYVRNDEDLHQVAGVFENIPGIDSVFDKEAQTRVGINHANSGQLILTAEHDRWFAYPWWDDNSQCPDYARHIDIHNKPGYDPCELFFGWPPVSVSLETQRIKGSHGRTGPHSRVAWASTLDMVDNPESLIELALETRNWLNTPL